MPRKLPQGWPEIFARGDKQIEEHTTFHISVDDGDILRDYYFATARLVIDGAVYEPQLRKGDSIKTSLTRAVDQAASEAQNVDTLLGKEFLRLGQSLIGARAEIGRWWFDHVSGVDGHKVFLAGPLTLLKVNENIAALTAMAEPYANISVGATRRVDALCRFEYKNQFTCGSTSSESTCNFMLNDPGGCITRHPDGLHRAKNGGFATINSGSRFKTS